MTTSVWTAEYLRDTKIKNNNNQTKVFKKCKKCAIYFFFK